MGKRTPAVPQICARKGAAPLPTINTPHRCAQPWNPRRHTAGSKWWKQRKTVIIYRHCVCWFSIFLPRRQCRTVARSQRATTATTTTTDDCLPGWTVVCVCVRTRVLNDARENPNSFLISSGADKQKKSCRPGADFFKGALTYFAGSKAAKKSVISSCVEAIILGYTFHRRAFYDVRWRDKYAVGKFFLLLFFLPSTAVDGNYGSSVRGLLWKIKFQSRGFECYKICCFLAWLAGKIMK